MRNTLLLTRVRMRLALRNRAFTFFSIVMPLGYLFVFIGVFAGGRREAVPYMLSEVLALTLMGSFWGLSIQLVTFREQGILRRFHLAPVGPAAMLASSLLSNYVMILPTVVIQFALAKWVFHMSQFGNLWGTFVFVTLGTVTFAAFGLIVASVTNTMQETQMINNAIWFLFIFLSGATLPFPMLPAWVQRVAVFLPATYLVTGLQQVMIRAASITQVGPELLALAGGAVLAFFLSSQLFRWEPEGTVPGRAKLRAAATVIPFLLLGAWESTRGTLRADAQKNFQTVQRASPQNETGR